jgi:hypothetical protein
MRTNVSFAGGYMTLSTEPQALGLPTFTVERAWDTAQEVNQEGILREMAEEIWQRCQERQLGVQALRIKWIGESTQVLRQRQWKQLAGRQAIIMARLWLLGQCSMSECPIRVSVEVFGRSLETAQLQWWENVSSKRALGFDVQTAPLAVSRRERLLQHWDVWRW